MNTAAKLTAYGAVLALVAGGAWAVGGAVGPFAVEAAPGGHDGTPGAGHVDPPGTDAPGTGTDGHGHQHGVGGAADLPGGLASSRGGYTLVPTEQALTAGANSFSFRITGPDGEAVTGYEAHHEKRMHLIVVRRDTSGYRHVHPRMAGDGTWTAPLDLTEAGSYRAFADFMPVGGAETTLGVDIAVAGPFEPRTYPPSRVAEVDGYRVSLTGDLVPGQESEVRLSVSRGGVPVTDLQPYLAAYGHLVALRQGDLAYLHVHPRGAPGDGTTAAGPEITFRAAVPSAGRYRLFLDFQHDGVVRTADLTVDTTAADPAPTAPAEGDEGGNGHG